MSVVNGFILSDWLYSKLFPSELVDFYKKRKVLVGITSYLALLASFFLSIEGRSESLKFVQGVLFFVFALVLSALLIFLFMYFSETEKPDDRLKPLFVGMFISGIIALIDYHVIRFAIEEFGAVLWQRAHWFRYSAFIFTALIIETTLVRAGRKFGWKNLWVAINEFAWITLLIFLGPWPNAPWRSYLKSSSGDKLMLVSFYAALLGLNLLLAFKLITRKFLYICMGITAFGMLIVSFTIR